MIQTRSQRLPQSLERSLVLAAQQGDKVARARLVEAFAPSIASVARIYRSSRAVDRLELMQDGVVGLLRALKNYDASRGTPFWAYASWWVRQAMQQLIAELTRPVVLSDRALRQLARVKDARRTYLQDHGREPSTTNLATTTGLTREQVENLVAVNALRARSKSRSATGTTSARRSESCSPILLPRTSTSASIAAWRSRRCATGRATCASANRSSCVHASGSTVASKRCGRSLETST